MAIALAVCLKKKKKKKRRWMKERLEKKINKYMHPRTFIKRSKTK